MTRATVASKLQPINLNIFIPFVFIFIGLLGAFHHSLWRDEMQGWLVAWRSDSWLDLWKNNAPSGHPVLWSALIYIFKNLTGTPLSMQLLQWILGSSAIICFWRWNPFPIWQKTLFTFGYFPFWEYYLISRHYVLAELLTFIFCSTYSLRRKSYLPSAICIGLLVNTHAFAWAIAFAIGVALISEWCFSPLQRISYKKQRVWTLDLIISISIVFLFSSFAAFSLMQAKDVSSIDFFNFDFRHLLRVFGRIFGGYLLIVPNYRSWVDLFICALIGGFMLFITLKFISRSRIAITFFLSGIISLFAFNYFIYLGIGSRHYGYYFLMFIAAIWLALHPSENSEASILKMTSINKNTFHNLFPYLLTFSLSVHFAAGIHRTITDFFLPYSAGKATANYIKEEGLQDLDVFATRDVEVSTVSGYLDKDFYYPELKGYGSYAKWNTRLPIKKDDVLSELNLFLTKRKDNHRLLILLSRNSMINQFDNSREIFIDEFKITPIKSFEKSWIDTERYYLYFADRVNRT